MWSSRPRLKAVFASRRIQVRLGDLLAFGPFGAIVNSANETLEGPLFPYFPIGAECESGAVYYRDDVVSRLKRA